MASDSNTVIRQPSPSDNSPDIQEELTENVPLDIHKLRDDIAEDVTRLDACHKTDAEIRRLPRWTSPIINPATSHSNSVWFKFRANGRYLEFLSLFLTGDRQVDIDFSSRHALILFLLNGLEKSHEKHFKRTTPEEAELLQMFAPDEFELQVWAYFIYGTDSNARLSKTVTDENGKSCNFYEGVCHIRQLAVHRTSTYRCNFSTQTIRCAAACALSLGDHHLLEQIELVTKVLYARATGHPNYPVTTEEASTVANLLWPLDSPVETDHEFLDDIQARAEHASYNFCKRHLPRELTGFGCTAAEHFELPQWHQVILKKCHSRAWISEEDQLFFYTVDEKLRKCEFVVRLSRNAAAHRPRSEFLDPGQHPEILTTAEKCVAWALEYVRALEDEETALEIEALAAEVLPVLKQRYTDWHDDIKWCQGRDLQLILEATEQRSKYWDDKSHVAPIANMYTMAAWRLRGFQSILAPPDEDFYYPPVSALDWIFSTSNDSNDSNSNNMETPPDDPPYDDDPAWPCEEEPYSSEGEESHSDTDYDTPSPTSTDQSDVEEDWTTTTLDPENFKAADEAIALGDWN
ncbi:MAG: hypothetical protein Q9186_001336 [Xanthomendoza sp. 1 TL-2023]